MLPIDYGKLLEDIRNIVREAIEESRREDIRRIGDVLIKMTSILEGMLGELSKHTKILEEHSRILEEHSRILEEHSRTLREHSRILEEHTKILEKHTKILEEHSRMLEEYNKILRRHSEILEEHTGILKSHSRMLEELRVTVGSMGRRWGRDLEKTVLAIYRDILASKGLDVEMARRFSYIDVDGRFGLKGSIYEFDVIVDDDDGVTVIEVKSRVEREDVEWFYEKVRRVESLLGRVKRVVVVAVNVDVEALKRAGELGVDVVYGAIVE